MLRLSRSLAVVGRVRTMSTPPQVILEPPGPVEFSIREKLTKLLDPFKLEIRNESSHHSHHAAMRARGGGNGQTHFSVLVVSDKFKGKATIDRHRMVYSMLSDEFNEGLHSLSLKTKTREEMEML